MDEHILSLRLERLRRTIAQKGITSYTVRRFRELVRAYYRENGRKLPWRETMDPYAILVSEIMLQQTQVDRVIGKYKEFMSVFPDISDLASASVEDVLRVWQGMGYNRRALSLHALATIIIEKHQGLIPNRMEDLVQLPGIGNATASDILVFAFNKPAIVVETNIRALFIYLFFNESEIVSDLKIHHLVEKTMDRKCPRDWYNGLMDIGSCVKRLYGNPARRSSHYTKQSSFEGSNRQMRSRVLRIILEYGSLSMEEITSKIPYSSEDVQPNLDNMVREGFLCYSEKRYRIQG